MPLRYQSVKRLLNGEYIRILIETLEHFSSGSTGIIDIMVDFHSWLAQSIGITFFDIPSKSRAVVCETVILLTSCKNRNILERRSQTYEPHPPQNPFYGMRWMMVFIKYPSCIGWSGRKCQILTD